MLASPVGAADLDALYDRLATASEQDAPRLEAEIEDAWQKSGSAAMDLLLERGQDALAAGDTAAAIDHFSALIDHAPDFAEGYNARAAAFFQEGEFGPAITDIGHVLTLDPRHFTAITGLALMLEEMDRPKEAIEAYRAALAIHPHLAGIRDSIDRLTAETDGQEI
ncbi:tetratricopeptide repeat protein [Falsirhodobacter sp. 20TX0035]|uniref:tetratricopeptide repeat protein n=1 Tax=Falsirhodobacter sp. 20TX0035 TaxID=3022019 RepID=UPI003FA58341